MFDDEFKVIAHQKRKPNPLLARFISFLRHDCDFGDGTDWLSQVYKHFEEPWNVDWNCYDISDMFVKIPHADTVDAFKALQSHFKTEIFVIFDDEFKVIGHQKRRPDPRLTKFISFSDMAVILTMELQMSAFMFGDVVVRQRLGHGMGKQSSPSLASLTVFFLKFKAWIQNSPTLYSLSTSFMDDTLEACLKKSWMKDYYEPILKKSSMSLKHEGTRQANQIQFMQFLINCDSPFPDYQYKPRDKLRYVQWSPIYGPDYFVTLVMSTLCTLELFSSNSDNFMKSLTDYLTIWSQRQWPYRLVKRGMVWYLKSRQTRIMKDWLPVFLQLWKSVVDPQKVKFIQNEK